MQELVYHVALSVQETCGSSSGRAVAFFRLFSSLCVRETFTSCCKERGLFLSLRCACAVPLRMAVLEVAVIQRQLCFAMLLSLNLGNSSTATRSSCLEGKGNAPGLLSDWVNYWRYKERVVISLECLRIATDCLEKRIMVWEANGQNIAAGMSRFKLLRLQEDSLEEFADFME